MDVKEVAAGCIALWNEQKWTEVFDTFYHDDAVNVEPVDWGKHPAKVIGKQAIIEKYEWVGRKWLIEHSFRIAAGPFYSANKFSILIETEVTIRETGERVKGLEVGVYTVEDGKVVREEILYSEAQLDWPRPGA